MNEPLPPAAKVVEAPHRPSTLHLHLPLTLLALTVATFLAAQLGALSTGANTMRFQRENLERQLKNTADAQKQLGELIIRREEAVKQAGQVQSQFVALFTELLELSRTDEDARRVVEKWKIQRSEPATPPATGAAAEPSPPKAP